MTAVEQRTCAVEGCDRRTRFSSARLCRAHWLAGQPPCSVEGCERPQVSVGLCGAHRRRWQRYGDPTFSPRPAVPTYSAVHQRVSALYGPARNYPCVLCPDGRAAQHWAYWGPGELTGLHQGRLRTYAAGPGWYWPLCAAHHAAEDTVARNGRCLNAEAREWFAAYLAERGAPELDAGTVIAAAAAAGIPYGPLTKARKEFGIQIERTAFGTGSVSTWYVPESLFRSRTEKRTGAA